MAVVADRVIVELEAKLDRYEANVRRAEQRFNSATNRIDADAKRMARSIQTNSAAAGASMRGLVGTLAAAFGAREIAALTDNYTRFTNQLKVAGLEGRQLSSTQETLFGIAQKNGVQLELLGRLYGGLASLQRDLNTTSADSIALTTAVSQSIRVSGTSAEAASGAILGLNQALAQTRVQSDEYNQILDGARPLLQAAVNGSERYRGSLARLKQDIEAGKVSGSDLFRILQGGFPLLAAQADKATMTISQAFTTLNNALGKYLGETDQTISATERIAQAIALLSENLDTVATALGLIASVYAARYVAGMVTMAASTGVASAAVFALQARMAGAATTAEALAFAGAGAGRTLSAAFGGPVGIAIIAVAASIYAVDRAYTSAGEASAEYVARQEQLRTAQTRVAEVTQLLATATGRARQEALANATATRAETQALLENARAALLAAQAKARGRLSDLRRVAPPPDPQNRGGNARDTRGFFAIVGSALGGGAGAPGPAAVRPGDAEGIRRERAVASADADVRLANEEVAGLTEAVAQLDATIRGGPRASSGGGTPDKPGRTRRGRDGPDPAEIEQRFASELAGLAQQTLAARGQMATSAAEEAELALRSVELARRQALAGVENEKAYNADQKTRLRLQIEALATAERANIEANRAQRVEQERADLAEQAYRNADSALRDQYDLADTAAERRALALQMLDLEYRYQKSLLEAVIANERLSDAERERARLALAGLESGKAAQEQQANRANESPLEAYRRRLNLTPAQRQEAAEQVVVDQLEAVEEGITNALSKALGTKDPLIASLLKMFVQNVIMRPLADALAGAQGGGGGGGGFLSSLFRIGASALSGGTAPSSGGSSFSSLIGQMGGPRASGGHVMAGRVYPINETGGEGFQAGGSGKIIPLGKMRGLRAGGLVVHQTVNVDASGVNPDGFAEHIKAAVRRETVAIVGQSMASATKSAPSRLVQFDRDGT